MFCNLALLFFATFPCTVTAQSFSGDGTETRLFIISSAEELADLATKINDVATTGTYSTKHYRLANDIDLSGYANWQPIAKELSSGRVYPFRGVFDGNNKKITNLKISGTSQYSGLFGAVYDGSVKNLSLENVNISGGDFTGGLVGIVNNAAVSNCSVTGNVTGLSQVGGIAGYLDSNSFIANCYATGAIAGSRSGSCNSSLAVVAANG